MLAVRPRTAVPAGGALAVDRDVSPRSSRAVLEGHPRSRSCATRRPALPEGPAIIATGPLTSDAFAPALGALVGADRLAFFDAAAPIVDAETIDRDVVFAASRYGKGGGRRLPQLPDGPRRSTSASSTRCSSARARARARTSRRARAVPGVPAGRGGRPHGPRRPALRRDKPVGLTDPRTGRRPWAVVQLRAGEPRGHRLQPRRLPDEPHVPRAAPGLPADPGPRATPSSCATASCTATPSSTRRGCSRRTCRCARSPASRSRASSRAPRATSRRPAPGLLAALGTFATLAGSRPGRACPRDSASARSSPTRPTRTRPPYQPMHVNFGLVPPLEPPVSRQARPLRRLRGARARRAGPSTRRLARRRASRPRSPEDVSA